MANLRRVPVAIAAATLVVAQGAGQDVDWQAIEQKLQTLQGTVAARDIKKSRDAANDFWRVWMSEQRKAYPTPAEYLRDAETRAAASPRVREISLPWMAKLAYDSGDLLKAEQYARETLSSPPPPSGPGDSIHDGNMVLGLIAVTKGDIAAAKTYLSAASKTPGTTITRRFGPNMKLAKELSQRREFPAVIEYLQTVRKIMTDNQSYIDDWIALLKGGRQPDFSRMLAP